MLFCVRFLCNGTWRGMVRTLREGRSMESCWIASRKICCCQVPGGESGGGSETAREPRHARLVLVSGSSAANSGVFEGRDPQMCTFGLSGCRVKPRRGRRLHTSAPAPQTPPKFHERTPEREEKNEFCGGRVKKKREIFGLPPFWSPPFWAKPFWPKPFWPPPFEPPLLGSMGPHPLHPPTTTQHTQKKPEQSISKNPNNQLPKN